MSIGFLGFLLFLGGVQVIDGRAASFLEEHLLHAYVKNPNEIEDYDVITLEVESRGRYRRSVSRKYATQVTFTAFGEDFHLDLIPAERFFSPDLMVEYVHEDGNVTKKPLEVDDCFYHGYVVSHNASGAAISLCNDIMHGIIATKGDTIHITPLKKEHAENYVKRHKRNSDKMHFIYKRNIDDHPYCDVEPSPTRQGETMSLEVVESVENSYIPPKYVEICLILDKDFVTNHTPDHEMYAMTLLNIISRRYTEPSLDVSLRIYIVRMIVLDSDTPTVDGQSFFINASLVSETLASLRTWGIVVNPEGDDDPGHWDNIFTLSGKDLISETSGSGLLGLAYTGGTCLSQLGVSINEDFGLSTGIVGSHELGHTMTLLHDQDEGCAAGYIMGSSPSYGQNIFKWSSCSSTNLKAYFRTGASACLNDVPSGALSPLVTSELPGETVSWEEQCSLLGYTACSSTIDCERLKCVFADGQCYLLGSHATAEGTTCGTGMVCLAGECVLESAVPGPIAGGWSQWTESSCSRTCGGGVVIRERACNNPTPTWGGAPCEGEGFEPRLCNTDVLCSVSSDGYRDEQCAATASVPHFDGMVYGWTSYFRSFLDFTDYCQNPCLRSDNMYYDLRPPGLNEDGTECWDYNVGDESIYLRCVRGFCLEFGCDGVQGSCKEFDVCRLCNGDGSSCTCETGSFTTGTTAVFNFFHEIPSGATSILITNADVIHGSHVAITGTVNGDFFRGSGSSPSPYIRWSVGSFIIRHEVGTTEVFRSTGPSNQPLRLEVYLNSTVQNSITYKYYLPNAGITYFWYEDCWGSCSETCGDGTEMRVVTCRAVEQRVTSVANDILCETNVGTKPDTVRSCNVNVCPSWDAGGFGSCNATCGDGIQTQTVSCQLNGIVVDESMCDAGSKPPTEHQPCNVGNCDWSPGSFGQCSVTCGTGTQTRTVECTNNDGVVPDVNCNAGLKPNTSHSCNDGSCDSPYWFSSPFGRCSVRCGKGIKTRQVYCRIGSVRVGGSLCEANNKPTATQECISRNCKGCDSVIEITDEKRSGTFSTPNFPKNYPARSRCSTWLCTEKGNQIRINFRRFHLQANIRRNCRYDRLTIKDLVTGKEERLCGSLGRFNRVYAHQVMLFFRSDNRKNFRGFKATYTAF